MEIRYLNIFLFRVAFYYNGTGTKSEYIYKVPKVVSLAEMTTRLQQLYPKVTFVSSDSLAVQQLESNVSDLPTEDSDPNQFSASKTNKMNQNGHSYSFSGDAGKMFSNCSVVVTHVTPFVEHHRNQFEKNVGIIKFVYEQRLNSKIAQSVAEQCKKRVILTASHYFPYFLKRIPVVDKQEIVLSPIEVAIDEMQERVHQLDHVITSGDAKHLQLLLQGSVHATVNSGPMAYANAFLKQQPSMTNGDATDSTALTPNVDEPLSSLESDSGFIVEQELDENQKHLKYLFSQFLDLCETALRVNEKLIKPNQTEYHNNLKVNFEKLRSELDFCNNRHVPIQIFDVISGSTYA